MSDATQTQTLEQTLNKTDFGHTIYENRKALIAAVIAVLVTVTGYVLWKQHKHSTANEIAVKVFEFQTKTWDGGKEGKVSISEVVKVFNGLDKDVQAAPVMVPVVLEMGKFMAEKGALEDAEAVLAKAGTAHPLSAFFVGMQRAVILEKMNKVPEAIAVLEPLAKDKEGIMSAKVNLELGRLNMALGEKAKAQTHLDYVVTTFPNDEAAKLAKLYLGKLAQ